LKDKIQNYIVLLDQYKELCVDLMLREKDKREALLNNDLKKIESVLQNQQAAVMKLKNFEHRRMALQSELGFADVTAEDMLKALEHENPEDVRRLRSIFGELKSTAVQIQDLNRISVEFAKKNLKFINLMMQAESGDAADGVYSPGIQSSKEVRYGHSLEKMI